MTSTNPTCLVNNVSTIDGVNVAQNTSVTIQLEDMAGVNVWNITCISTDELHSASTITSALTIDNVAKTATFNMPTDGLANGTALIFRSVVNNGTDINGSYRQDYATQFGIYTLVNGLRIAAPSETVEGSSQYGWTVKFNEIARNAGGGGGSYTAGGDLSGNATSQQVNSLTGGDYGVVSFPSIRATPKITQATRSGDGVQLTIEAQSSSDESGGALALLAGSGGTSGGSISINGGSGQGINPGGDINIQSGHGNPSGNIIIQNSPYSNVAGNILIRCNYATSGGDIILSPSTVGDLIFPTLNSGSLVVNNQGVISTVATQEKIVFTFTAMTSSTNEVNFGSLDGFASGPFILNVSYLAMQGGNYGNWADDSATIAFTAHTIRVVGFNDGGNFIILNTQNIGTAVNNAGGRATGISFTNSGDQTLSVNGQANSSSSTMWKIVVEQIASISQ